MNDMDNINKSIKSMEKVVFSFNVLLCIIVLATLLSLILAWLGMIPYTISMFPCALLYIYLITQLVYCVSRTISKAIKKRKGKR